MKYSATLLALTATLVSAQYDEDYSSTNGRFQISTKNQSDATFTGPTRLASCSTNPIITLNDGVLIDQDNRQAEVVANHQFQFDSPLQDERKYIDGFSVFTDPNNANKLTLAHPDGNGGNNDTFYSCNSGSFSNLYDENIDGKCVPIYIEILPCGNRAPAYASSKPSDQASGGAAQPTSASDSTTASSAPMTSASSTAAATSAPVESPTSVPTMAPVPAPYPTGNATVPSASGTGSPSSTAPGSSTSSPLTAPASGAEALAIGSKFGAVAAALIAFAML